ncbi:MAG: F0F1 ATP synthase subunit B [Pseudomonadota bacterium]
MKNIVLTTSLVLLAAPVAAATKNPFSPEFYKLSNTDFIVTLGFILFIGILVYFKVPGMLTKALDERAAGIKSELDEAKALREEAQTLLASYERKQKDVQAQADAIVTAAREEAEAAAEQAKADIATSVARRLAAAEEQIASAQASAVKDVRDQAVTVAVAAAQDVIAKTLTATDGNKLIDQGIAEVQAKLH